MRRGGDGGAGAVIGPHGRILALETHARAAQRGAARRPFRREKKRCVTPLRRTAPPVS